MKKSILYTALLGTLLLGFSCNKQLNQTPKYGLNAETVYKDPNNYIKVLAKLYSGLSMTGNQGPAGQADIAGIDEGFSAYVRVLWNLQELPTDEAICGWNDPGLPELNKTQWNSENIWVKGMYYRIYYQITLCNEFIWQSRDEKLAERGFSDSDIATIRTYRNEARFLRALSYYHAMDLFGNVPFVDENDRVGAFQPPQIQRADLFQYIEGELLDLSPKLMTAGAAPYGRASQTAVQSLLAKLYLNALWGKFAQRPSAQGHIYLYSDRQFFQFWHDHRINHEHTSFRIMYPGVYQAYYQYKPQFCQPVGHANVFIAAAVTAGARTVLHQRLLKIQSHHLTDRLGVSYPRILYCDTDSVIFIWPKQGEELTSVGLGHWTDEYPDATIQSFFALAPKVYALLFDQGKQSTKAKGVQLTLANQSKLSLEAITPLLEECARKVETEGAVHSLQTEPTKIQLYNFNIYSNSTSKINGYATMFSRYNYKDMRIIITKRKIHGQEDFEVGQSSMLYTVPLGSQ